MKISATTNDRPMEWKRLICDKRLGLEHTYQADEADTEGKHVTMYGSTRSDFQRDYDRLVFSSPFRRLQNKTQVFPLPGSIFVHNRLTHSLEVACVGRSLASEVSAVLRTKYAGKPWVHKLEAIDEIVSAACLAHDLGNPPFGHSGEKAIASFFSEGPGLQLKAALSEKQWCDLTRFDGNANAFRLLTHQFNGRRPGGFAMTYSTLASIVKYPYDSSLAGHKNKFGFFTTEAADFRRIAEELGMTRLGSPGDSLRYARHPLVYLVEAADDICYEIMDIEDAHKLSQIPTQQVVDLMLGFYPDQEHGPIQRTLKKIDDPNEKVGYLRSIVINTLVKSCAQAFIINEKDILGARFEGNLLDHIPQGQKEAYGRCNALSWEKIYHAPDVVDIDLAGTSIITFLLQKLLAAVQNPEFNYSKLLLSKVPQQYQVNAPTLFERVQAVVDHVSGMTDVYALELYRRLNAMSLKLNN